MFYKAKYLIYVFDIQDTHLKLIESTEHKKSALEFGKVFKTGWVNLAYLT